MKLKILAVAFISAITLGLIGTAVAESGGPAASPVVAMGTHHYE